MPLDEESRDIHLGCLFGHSVFSPRSDFGRPGKKALRTSSRISARTFAGLRLVEGFFAGVAGAGAETTTLPGVVTAAVRFAGTNGLRIGNSASILRIMAALLFFFAAFFGGAFFFF